MENDRDASELLSAAIADPFIWDLDGHDSVTPWFKYASEHFPLWTLQAEAYLKFQPGDLPSTYPMWRLIESILRGDGITQEQREHNQILHPLDERVPREQRDRPPSFC